MGIIRSLYTNNQPVTISLDSLPFGDIAVSDPIDNSVDKFIAADIQLQFKTGISVSALGQVLVYMFRSVDGGVTYDDTEVNASLITSFVANEMDTSYVSSAETASQGQLPEYWKLGVMNLTGDDFDATPSNFSLKFNGKRFEST